MAPNKNVNRKRINERYDKSVNICHQCSFDNPNGIRYCGNCGARLAQDLAAIPADSPPVSPQPVDEMVGADLLERFRRAGLEARGQQRNVTVLFADMSGYTGLSEQLDNEDVFDLIQQFINMLVEHVYTYEGFVDKLTGDGIMAIFGAPIAYENNASGNSGERGV